jgi:hypothetical protein
MSFMAQNLKYTLPKNLVWSLHIFIGLLFITISSIYLFYKDKDSTQVSINTDKLNEATYIIILILGSFMIMYHGHLYLTDKGLLKKMFGE